MSNPFITITSSSAGGASLPWGRSRTRRRGPWRCARPAAWSGSGRGAGRTAWRRTRRWSTRRARCCRRRRPGTPSITSRWMPWKWIVCGWLEPLAKRIRSRSPSRARSVGPGHAAVVGPGGVLDARRHLDLAVLGDDLPLAHAAPDHVPSSKSRRIVLRVEAVARVVDAADGAQVPGAAVAGLVRRARRRRRAADELPPCSPWCGISSCRTGSAALAAAAPPSSLPPRDFVVPELSHQALLKHNLGETKNRIEHAMSTIDAVIATSEYELVTESAGCWTAPSAREVRSCAAPRRPTSSRARSPTTWRRSPPARAATRRSSTTRASCAPTCASCAARTGSGSTPRRSATPCCAHMLEHLLARPRRAVGGRRPPSARCCRWSGPAARRRARRRAARRASTPSSTGEPACACAPTSAWT